MREQLKYSGQTPPEGAFTTEEYAARAGIPITTAGFRLRKLVAAGKLRTGKFRWPGTPGRRFWWKVQDA